MQLRARAHVITRMQEAWNTYGEGVFAFTVLQVVGSAGDFGKARIAEAEWIHALEPTYNRNRPQRSDVETREAITPPQLIETYRAAFDLDALRQSLPEGEPTENRRRNDDPEGYITSGQAGSMLGVDNRRLNRLLDKHNVTRYERLIDPRIRWLKRSDIEALLVEFHTPRPGNQNNGAA